MNQNSDALDWNARSSKVIEALRFYRFHVFPNNSGIKG
jgi:hypothetical protein